MEKLTPVKLFKKHNISPNVERVMLFHNMIEELAQELELTSDDLFFYTIIETSAAQKAQPKAFDSFLEDHKKFLKQLEEDKSNGRKK